MQYLSTCAILTSIRAVVVSPQDSVGESVA